MTLKLICVSLTLGALLTGCGGGTDSTSTSNPNPSTGTVVQSLTVKSNHESTSTTPEISVAKQNFEFSWIVKSPQNYHIDAYISADTRLTDDDRRFVSLNCGMGITSLCDSQKTAICRIEPQDDSYIVSCSNTGMQLLANIGTLTLPQTTHVLIKVCDALVENCTTVSQPIKFVG